MGWSFRESIKILPGIRLNFSRRGVSASVGTRGLHLGIGGGRPPRLTGGIGPLHYYQSLGPKRGDHHTVAVPTRRRRAHFHLLTLLVVSVAAWFGWKALSPESKSALVKPVSRLLSTPTDPSTSPAHQTTVLPSDAPSHPPTSPLAEERRVPKNEASKRKGPSHTDSSR